MYIVLIKINSKGCLGWGIRLTLNCQEIEPSHESPKTLTPGGNLILTKSWY